MLITITNSNASREVCTQKHPTHLLGGGAYVTFMIVHTCVYRYTNSFLLSRIRILKTNCNDHSSYEFSLVCIRCRICHLDVSFPRLSFVLPRYHGITPPPPSHRTRGTYAHSPSPELPISGKGYTPPPNLGYYNGYHWQLHTHKKHFLAFSENHPLTAAKIHPPPPISEKMGIRMRSPRAFEWGGGGGGGGASPSRSSKVSFPHISGSLFSYFQIQQRTNKLQLFLI